MKAAIFAYSRQGVETAGRIVSCLSEGETRAYTLGKFLQPGFSALPDPARSVYEESFAWADAMIFVGSCGIAVRQIAPFVKSKAADPAVLCMDELAKFVIPILSGHIGGANALALQLAECLGAIPVVTTATDIHGRFSVDAWAAKNDMVIDDLKAAKAVSAAILEGDVPLHCDLPVCSALPVGVVAGDSGKIGICISWKRENPFDETLRLIPKRLHLGIGCRRGTPAETISRVVKSVFDDSGIDFRAVKQAASIDLKADEPGLLQFCGENDLPVSFYTADALMQLPGSYSASDFVQRMTGVDNVCERAAMMGAERLIVKKTAADGVTVAIAAERYEVSFG